MRSRPTWRAGSAAKDMCRQALAIMGAIGASSISAAERPKFECVSPEVSKPFTARSSARTANPRVAVTLSVTAEMS